MTSASICRRIRSDWRRNCRRRWRRSKAKIVWCWLGRQVRLSTANWNRWWAHTRRSSSFRGPTMLPETVSHSGNLLLFLAVKGNGVQWHRNEFESELAHQSAGKLFLVVPLHFFGSKSSISRFGERFRDGQYSLVSLLFAVFLLTVSPVPSHL